MFAIPSSIIFDILKEQWQWLSGPNESHFYKLGDHLGIFLPGVFPKTYELTLAPVMSALELQYQRMKLTKDRPARNAPNMPSIQIASLLERAIVYGVTGDRRVLPPTLCRPLGLDTCLTQSVLPCFSDVVSFTGLDAPSVPYCDWPVLNDAPVLVSIPTVRHHYDSRHAEVSRFFVSFIFTLHSS